jgi:Pentapeptide repeats (8 copies)
MKRPDWLKLSPPMVFGLVAVGVLGLGWVVIYLPRLQTASLSQKIKGYETSAKADPEKLATLEKGQIDSENAIRTGLIQGIGGTALLIGLYFTYQNLRATQRNVEIAEEKQVTERKTAEANLKLAEAKQVTERFSKAVEMLGNEDSLHVRLGGIYALERIARDSDDDYWQVMEVLTAFVRSESPWPPKQTSEGSLEEKAPQPVEVQQPVEESSPVVEGETNQGAEPQTALSERKQRFQEEQAFRAALPILRTDLQAVMTVIGRRKHRYEEGETQRLDLRSTDLRKLQAREANLTGFDLSGAHLEGADLSSALRGSRTDWSVLRESSPV